MKIFARKNSIRTQLSLYMVTLSVVLLALCATLIHETQQTQLEKAVTAAWKNQEMFQRTIQQIRAHVDVAFSFLEYSESCQELVTCETYAQVTPSLAAQLKKDISFSRIANGCVDVAILSDLVAYSSIFLQPELETFSQRMPAGHGTVPLGLVHPRSPQYGGTYFLFGYHYYANSKKLGTVFCTIELSGVETLLPLPQEDGCYLILEDEWGNRLIWGGENSKIERRDLLQLLENNGQLGQNETLRSKEFTVHALKLQEVNGMLYSVIDMRTIKSNLNYMYGFSLVLACILIVIYWFYNAKFYKSIVKPLNQFSHYVLRCQKMEKLEENINTPISEGCAEMQTIEREFNNLLQAISNLTKEVQQKTDELYQAELRCKDATIKALRSQINPHFLYNTLELIRADAIAGKTKEVSAITSAMGKMYRYAIKGAQTVTLKEELESVKAYICIQQARSNGRFSVIYSIAADTQSVCIPKMILQPLVENAFLHGLEPRNQEGIIFIGTSLQDGCLEICVRDDGIGIAKLQLEQIVQQIEGNGDKRNNMSVGLENVVARLRLQYGEKVSYSLTSSPNAGTCIILKVPM